MNIWLYGEIFLVVVLTIFLCANFKKIKTNGKAACLWLFVIFIIALNFIFGDTDVIKIAIYFYLIFLSYKFPSIGTKLLLLMLIVFTLFNLFSYGYNNKLSAIPFILIISLISIVKPRHEMSKQMLLIFLLFVMLELLQSVLFHYRGSFILACVSLLYFVFRSKYKKHLISVVCIFPVLYILGMLCYSFLLVAGYDLPVSISNIERSSMVLWGAYNYSDYLIIGPGQEVFQNIGGKYKLIFGFSDEIPSDPHSFIIEIFILSGGLVSVICYLLFIIKVNKINRIINDGYHYFMFIAIPLFLTFSMFPFNAHSRVITAVLFGLILSLPRRASRESG